MSERWDMTIWFDNNHTRTMYFKDREEAEKILAGITTTKPGNWFTASDGYGTRWVVRPEKIVHMQITQVQVPSGRLPSL